MADVISSCQFIPKPADCELCWENPIREEEVEKEVKMLSVRKSLGMPLLGSWTLKECLLQSIKPFTALLNDCVKKVYSLKNGKGL